MLRPGLLAGVAVVVARVAGARALVPSGALTAGVAGACNALGASVFECALATSGDLEADDAATRESVEQALAQLASDPKGALASAQSGTSRDPLSAQALFTLSTVEQASGQPALARATLQRAVHLQPSNPQTWLALARYDLASDPAAALSGAATVIMTWEDFHCKVLA